MTGFDIVIELKRRKSQGQPGTQRWLLEELRNRGYPNLAEPTLSNILNGHYTVGCANDVLTTAASILSDQSSDEAAQVS